MNASESLAQSDGSGRGGEAQPFKSGQVYRIRGWRLLFFWPACLFVRLWHATLRLRIDSREEAWLRSTEIPKLLIGWHNRSFIFSEILRRFHDPRKIHVLVSPSRMAAWEADFFSTLGIQSIRGSSSRRSINATRELLAIRKSGQDIGISPDGPSGPLYDFKRGAVFLARVTDAPMALISANFRMAWRLNSWDRHFFPFPFSRVDVRIGRLPPYSQLDCENEEEAAIKMKAALMDITVDTR